MDTPQDNQLLNQAYNSLIQIYNRDLWTGTPNGCLYHYTPAEGLLGIIESQCLHASLAYLLNDASEVSYGCGIVLSAIEELRITYKPTRSSCAFSTICQQDFRLNLAVPPGHIRSSLLVFARGTICSVNGAPMENLVATHLGCPYPPPTQNFIPSRKPTQTG